ncbi:acetyltransferase [Antrihabitans stalactiti]|uniref:Acetyltransferase n=1 Tax=Antrihabitans stalactiti TaxID=2584121 RepID=A0A848KBD0_9NOCA|nr:acetyltransferase [Antrihabitans stalactiti]NMN94012.1 acetyltransferase [Antrihabitans stalactiti]
MQIRKPHFPNEIADLTAIWKRASEATHTFLTAADVAEIEVKVREEYLPHAFDQLWVAADDSDRAVGFLGLDGPSVDALWVDPDLHGTGIGTALLDFAATHHRELTVDVNEQNPKAHDFYRRRGFVDVGRSEDDGEGRPFPIIHMRIP